MCKLTFFAVIVMMALAAELHASEDFESVWQEYLAKYPLGVQTKAEYGLRKSIFNETHARIKKHNSKKGVTFQMEHNSFSVLTDEEKQSYVGAFKPVRPDSVVRGVARRDLPLSIDYRTHSCMPPVRNQGGCSSCWAHSATAVVEFGKCKKAGGKARDLSEQQVVDCSQAYGCSGGWEHQAWEYLAANGGQTTEGSYPYTGVAGTCRFSPSAMPIGAQVSSSNTVEWVAQQDQTAMKAVLAGGRILTVYMELPASFYNYKSGIFNDDRECVRKNAHAMNVVGYGTLDNNDYWVIRNSWGADWGIAGYVLVKRGVNLCWMETLARTTNIV